MTIPTNTRPTAAAATDVDTSPAGEPLSADLLIRHMGHDFNNLFSIILGGLSLLREEIPQDSWHPEAREVYDDVVSAAREAAEVVSQLTAWAARQAIEPENVDLNEVAHEFQRVLAPTLPAGVTLELHLHDAPVMSWVDRARLHDALLALVANALDAMHGAGTLCIETTATAGATIAVCDSGQGMDAATLARCRDPYFSSQGGVAHRGLGLSVVDGYVRASNGTLQIASTPGAGTRVSLTFPPARGQG